MESRSKEVPACFALRALGARKIKNSVNDVQQVLGMTSRGKRAKRIASIARRERGAANRAPFRQRHARSVQRAIGATGQESEPSTSAHAALREPGTNGQVLALCRRA
mmetsp:Transcript_33500/g.41220  ORF Transcript_33500/g.41220 Transcript_33500/m.41220 type:complete len:107 (-) Transcript_33500:325-645(-)